MWLSWMTAAALASGGVDRPALEVVDLEDGASAQVVGGERVQPGDWEDAAALVVSRSYVNCTGTLVAPTLVITAAHCIDGAEISHVLLGSTNYFADEGDFFEVKRQRMHGKYRSTAGGYDVAFLELATEAVGYTPRKIALDCVVDDLVETGDEVAIVGFGATSADGSQSTSTKREGYTTIYDKDCSLPGSGCDPQTIPGGEIVAGGDGVNACFGDSGGPLYWLGDHVGEDDHVIGIASRVVGAPPRQPCGARAIWARPDYFINWLQNQSGIEIPHPQCNDAPLVDGAPIATVKGEPGTTTLSVSDDGDAVGFAIAVDPAHGTATVTDDGEVRYVPEDGFVGEDSFIVAVTDDGSAYEASPPVTVEHEVAVSVEGGGCGCSTSGAPAGVFGAVLLGLFTARRRG